MAQPHISSADRIQDLSSINSSIPVLLSSAGNAIQALTGKPVSKADQPATNGDIELSPSNTSGSPDLSLQASKEAFTTNAQEYFNTLQAIMARLRRQAYALEEAGIIAAEAPGLASSSGDQQQQQQQQQQQPLGGRAAAQTRGANAAVASHRQLDETDRLVNGGLGGLDVAFLNSRVGRGDLDKEAELLDTAKAQIQDAITRAEAAREDAPMGEAS